MRCILKNKYKKIIAFMLVFFANTVFAEDFSKMVHYGIGIYEGIYYDENCYFIHTDCKTNEPLTGDRKKEEEARKMIANNINYIKNIIYEINIVEINENVYIYKVSYS